MVKELRVKLGDKVSEGSPLLMLEARRGAAAAPAPAPQPAARRRRRSGRRRRRRAIARRRQAAPAAGGGGPVEVVVPDIGDFDEVAVIEVCVKPGDTSRPSRA